MKFKVINIVKEKQIYGETKYFCTDENKDPYIVTFPNDVEVTHEMLKERLENAYAHAKEHQTNNLIKVGDEI